MRKILFITALSIVLTAATSCTENMDYKDVQVGSVGALFLPAAGAYTELSSLSGQTVTFSWEGVTTQDGLPAFYEVVFMSSPTGPIQYRVDAGANTTVDISHKQINIAAGKTGIESGDEGVMYWSVVANRGLIQTTATASASQFSVTRLSGFDVIPATLYLTGTATEAGTTLGNALQCRISQDSEDTYEVITRLTAGEMRFVESTTDGARSFAFSAGEIQEIATPTSNTETGIFRIRLDFSTRGYSLKEISSVEYNFAPRTADNTAMTYQGKGIWKMSGYDVAFREEGFGLDNRYSFLAHFADGSVEIWGSVNYDNSGQGPATGEGDYNNIHFTPRGTYNAYDYTFKMNSAFDGTKVDMTLDMSGEGPSYTHIISAAN